MASKLAHQHVARLISHKHVARLLESQGGAQSEDPELVGQGKMKLYSFYEPSLVGGDYWIDSFQFISVTDVDKNTQTKQVFNYKSEGLPDPPPQQKDLVRQMQKFEVVAPQFSIPLDHVTTHYPPDGHQDEGRVLPHVVLNDPHLPWERYAGSNPPFNGPIRGAKTNTNRESVPWMAVVVFDADELLLSGSDLKTLAIPTMPIAAADGDVTSTTKVPPNGAYSMSVSQYLTKIDRLSRVEYEADSLIDELKTSQEGTSVIFPTKDLFKQIFVDKSGGLSTLEQLKGLAHVRNINTTGMPDAGVEETGLFSLVISRRTGPVNLTVPKTQMAHLISIENFDATIKRADTSTSTRIGLVSLFSWTYTALPPNPINFLDSMIAIGRTTQMIKPDQAIFDGLNNAKASTKLTKRLDNGYVFSRWRTQTGEESVAFNRGPLVPAPVTPPSTDSEWPGSSNYGTDYQILDTDLGVMDISYSSAWQLGKTLAIGDRVFCAALMRFRGLVHAIAASETRTTVGTSDTAEAVLGSIKSHIKKIVDLSISSPNDPQRLPPPGNRKLLAPGINSTAVQPTFQENLRKEARNQMLSRDFTEPNGVGKDLYNGFNKPVNSDWAVILNWITTKLYLDGIPTHYLIVDPSHLPMERLRFFHIDPNWLDCLIDGALSACNHADRGDDIVRNEIKAGYNRYLDQTLPSTTHKPQVPRFGFIIRSAVVKAFPGLHIEIPFPAANAKDETRATICHFTAINDTTLMCLLDRGPEELESITITQPPHQQRFSLGENIDPKTNAVEFQFMDLYANPDPKKLVLPEKEWPRASAEDLVHDEKVWDPVTRCIDVVQLKTLISKYMTDKVGKDKYTDSDDDLITSLPIGLELNDPCYFLLYTNKTPKYAPQTLRHLWKGPPTPSAPPITKPPLTPTLVADPSSPIAKDPPSQPRPTPIRSQPPNLQTGISTSLTPKGTGPAITGTPRIQYTCAIYPDYLPFPKYASHPDYTIPTHNTYLMDLIFSLKRVNLPSATDNFYLSSIVLDIPLSPSNPSAPVLKSDPEPLLAYPYTGPGPRMLSNLRFTVSLNRPANTNILQIVLVPRGKAAVTMKDRRLMDLSFKLSQCAIAEIVQPLKTPQVAYPKEGWKPGTVAGLGTCKVAWREGYTFAEKGSQVGFVTSATPVTVFKKGEGSDVF